MSPDVHPHEFASITFPRSHEVESTGRTKNMDNFINSAVREALHHYEHATPTDFGALALGIVVVSWFFSRFYGD